MPEPDRTDPHPEQAAPGPGGRGVAVELPDSRAEPGGPPVRVDTTMVDTETAEAMRPSSDPRHAPGGPPRAPRPPRG